MNLVNLDESKLTEPSRKLLSLLREKFPDWEKYIKMINYLDDEKITDKFHLRVVVPSPVNDENRKLIMCFCTHEDDVSLFYGNWHSHGWKMYMPLPSDYEAFVDFVEFVKMITQNRICLYKYQGKLRFDELLDIENAGLIEEILTDSYGNGKIEVISWDGLKDMSLDIDIYKGLI